jgi:hypothetical protein
MPVYSDPGTVTFDTVIRRNDGGGSFVEFPGDTVALFGARGRVPITATFDGAAYRGSITPYNGMRMIVVTLELQNTISKSAGDAVHVEVRLDTAERVVELADDIEQALRQSQRLAQFRNLSYSHQREYEAWISGAKRPETRSSRIDKMMELLAKGKSLT